jgi:Disulphide bond corrector protein DsbC
MKMGSMKAAAVALMLAVANGSGVAQQFGDLDGGSNKPKSQEFIVYAAEQQAAVAGKPSTLELNFRVIDGLHVNSHTPKSDLLIATTLTMDAAPGVKVGDAVYPAGSLYSFSFDPSEKLDVYTGGFTVKLPVVAQAAGSQMLSGKLRYQACDRAACYPPKILPVQVAVAVR